jgi:hypothetical protein
VFVKKRYVHIAGLLLMGAGAKETGVEPPENGTQRPPTAPVGTCCRSLPNGGKGSGEEVMTLGVPPAGSPRAARAG